MKPYTLTGNDLKTARRKKGMNQTAFGRSVGLSRCTISYWETKDEIFVSPAGPREALRSICQALVLPIYPTSNARAREWGIIDAQQSALDREIAKRLAQAEAREAERAAKRRVVCGAKTRKGHPCRLMSEPGRKRCKFHGGMSTGPKTEEGRERIAEAQRRRWTESKRRVQFLVHECES